MPAISLWKRVLYEESVIESCKRSRENERLLVFAEALLLQYKYFVCDHIVQKLSFLLYNYRFLNFFYFFLLDWFHSGHTTCSFPDGEKKRIEIVLQCKCGSNSEFGHSKLFLWNVLKFRFSLESVRTTLVMYSLPADFNFSC